MAKTLASHIQEVAMRIIGDGEFAAEVRRAGIAAVRGGASSQAFADYFNLFARTPGELAGLGGGAAGGCTCDSNTWFTISSIAGPLYTCCATTTTTTTSGNFFAA